MEVFYSLVLLISLQEGGGVVRESARQFQELDPYGGAMALIAMSVVFLSLLILYLAFYNISVYLNRYLQRKALRKKGITGITTSLKEEHSGEINAAIAMAIYLYSEQIHDLESLKLTINRVSRTYSPWSSKIYGLRQIPQKMHQPHQIKLVNVKNVKK
ncbi:MAG TPA: OadG family protein [Bacteroidia bacterium]|nr:OadG family protein [Sphingobacteriales bacterium]HPD64636.1 OadG family protein [Bacteroidia bacterium]HRS58482.1 OadG family protein [Bacteroidia bacterium]HRU68387.1 OadG family protein [Bacteroidia bacterium]